MFNPSPLHLAAHYGDIDKVRELLDNKADPNFQGLFGLTPLHVAASNGNCEVLKYLIDNGGDIHAVNMCGATILHSACQGLIEDRSNWRVIRLLLEWGHSLPPSECEIYPFKKDRGPSRTSRYTWQVRLELR